MRPDGSVVDVFSRDYVLRLIEQLASALAALRARVLNQQLDPAQLNTDIRAIAQQAGLDLDVARRLDPSSLLMWLAPYGDADPGRLWLMAELLYLTARSQRPPDIADLDRARAIFDHLPEDWRPHADLASASERVAEIGTITRLARESANH